MDLFNHVTPRCIVDVIKEIGFYRRIWSSSFTSIVVMSVPFLYLALTAFPSIVFTSVPFFNTALLEFIYNSINFYRFLALIIAFLCYVPLNANQTNKQVDICHMKLTAEFQAKVRPILADGCPINRSSKLYYMILQPDFSLLKLKCFTCSIQVC